jgi:hypothetical protein
VYSIKDRFLTSSGDKKKLNETVLTRRGDTARRTVHSCTLYRSDVAANDLVILDTPPFDDTPDDKIPD